MTQHTTAPANDKNVVDFPRPNVRNSDIPPASAADQATNVGNPDIRDSRVDDGLPLLTALFDGGRPVLVWDVGAGEERTDIGLKRMALQRVVAKADRDAPRAAVYFSVQAADGLVWCLWREAPAVEWDTLLPPPTGVLTQGETALLLYALTQPMRAEEADALARDMACDLAESLPLPGANGWTLAHLDPAALHSPADLMDVFREPTPAVTESTEATFVDARVLSPLDLEADELQADMVISVGANFQSKKWRADRMSKAKFVALLARHPVGKQKDGPGFVLGEVIGDHRRKQAVKACWGIGLDIDVGMPGRTIDEALADLGCLAIRYTTFSHGKTVSKINRDKIVKWADKRGLEFDADTVAQYLAEEVRWDKRILDSAEYYGDVHEPEGVLACIRHAPMEKHRVVVPLAEPFVPSEVGKTHAEGMKAWADVCRALARTLGDLPMDHSAVDPSRLFFFPRHAKGEPHETTIHGGPLFDWRSLDLSGAVEGDDFDRALAAEIASGEKTKSKSQTQEGRDLGRWSIKRAGGFQIVEVIRDYAEDRIRTPGTSKVDIECPFDEDHSNPGDPEDRGCFAVNAGDGPSPVFTVKCQHDSCQGKTNLDFLGKMLKDEWFPRGVLEDETYNAVLDEASPSEAAPPKGGVAVGGVLDDLDDFDPDRRIFEGDTACDDAIREMGKVVSVLTQGNRTRIAIRTRSGLVFNSKSDAGTRFDSYRAIFTGLDAKGKPKEKNLSALDLLLKSDQVRIYDGIDCDPTNSLPPHILNTWEGLAVAPAPGDCSRILAHIHDCICAGDGTHTAVLLGFFAHMFQKPAEKPGFAPVVIGPKGCGKSTVGEFICRAIGRKHSVKIAQAKHLTGAFNAHLAGKLFVQAEEVTFGGDRKNEGVLKDAITARAMLTEPKGLDAYQESNFSRFFLVTNPGHAVPASDGERRWFVLQARDLFEGKPHDDPDRVAYFGALYAEADNGGIAAFVDYLMSYDISDFLPFAAPHTEALADQVRQSLADDDLWIMGALQTGQFDTRDGESLGGYWRLTEPLEIDAADVQRSFDSHVRRYGGSSGGSGVCRAVLERYGEVQKKRRGTGTRQSYYVLGPRQGWQAAFTRRFGITFADEAEEV